jgi:hypothetical protein
MSELVSLFPAFQKPSLQRLLTASPVGHLRGQAFNESAGRVL